MMLLLVLTAFGPSGCGDAPPGEGPAALPPSPLESTGFRVRGWIEAPLNEDTGWATPTNADAVVFADQPFRIRFEVAAPATVPAGALPTPFTLQARRNGGAWETLVLRDFPYPDEISTPRVSLVQVEPWGAGRPTTDLLPVSQLPFAPGVGVSDTVTYDAEGDALASDSAAGPWPPADRTAPLHGEWEWPVVIRRWADGAVTNESGDTFDFRMVDGAGRAVEGVLPRVTLRIPEGLLGGTYVETPGVLGPWQGDDGTLYFPMEPAETFNVLMMVASGDHGATWAEVDGSHRPATDDLEGFATVWVDGTLYLLHQISEATVLHAFDTRATPQTQAAADTDPDSPPLPGAWVIRDEPVSTHSEPPTQVAALVALSDGRLVAVYGDSTGLLHRTRAPEGGWSAEGRVPVEGAGVASGIMAARAAGDVVHLGYTVTAPDGSARTVRHRTLSADGTFGSETVLAEGLGTAADEVGALLPLGWVEGPNTVVVAWRGGDGRIRERRIRSDGTVSPAVPVTSSVVVQSGADSEQVGADLVVHEGVVHVVFTDADSGDLWHTTSPAPGTWTPARPVVEGIEAQWVRGRVVTGRGGEAVYGLVYDAGSDGGSGMNRYLAVPLTGG